MQSRPRCNHKGLSSRRRRLAYSHLLVEGRGMSKPHARSPRRTELQLPIGPLLISLICASCTLLYTSSRGNVRTSRVGVVPVYWYLPLFGSLLYPSELHSSSEVAELARSVMYLSDDLCVASRLCTVQHCSMSTRVLPASHI